MHSESPLERCPNCRADLRPFLEVGQELPFCHQCRFPLQIVAGKYQLLQQVGEGGFSTVYLATHRGLTRNASRVVKILKPELFDVPGVERRFKREVQLTSELSQENDHIVRVFDDFGVIEQLGYYYVMEYLEGKVLSDYLNDDQRLPALRWCVDVIDQVCQGMQVAHEAGVIHRDLKPDNLLLIKRRKKDNFVKILDFGIAGLLESAEGERSRFTKGPIGTPWYMSPEQGMNQSPDARSDLYSIGIILYELLTGHVPFVPKGQQGGVSALEVMANKMMTEPVPPHQLRPDRGISPELSTLVMELLARQPDERVQSTEELQERLAMFLQPESPPALHKTDPAPHASATKGYLTPYSENRSESQPPQPTLGWVPTPEQLSASHHPTPVTAVPTGWEAEAGAHKHPTPHSPPPSPPVAAAFGSVASEEPLPPRTLFTASYEESEELRPQEEFAHTGNHASSSHTTTVSPASPPLSASVSPQSPGLESEHTTHVDEDTSTRLPILFAALALAGLSVLALVWVASKRAGDGPSSNGGLVVTARTTGLGVTPRTPARRREPAPKPLLRPLPRVRKTLPVARRAPLRLTVPRKKRPVRSRRRIVRKRPHRCKRGWKRLIIQGRLRTRLVLEPKRARRKKMRGGWCVSPQTQFLEVKARGYQTCVFPFSALKQRHRIGLKKRGRGFVPGGYCLSP